MRVFCVAAVLLTGAAGAQTMDFAEWCRDVALHDSGRCTEVRAEDKAAFDTYASRTAQFEAELKAKRARDEALNERMERMGTCSRDRGPGD